MYAWEDLRILLTLSREGTLTAAAARLHVDQTTVSRRMRALEEQSPHRLFERLRGGVVVTPAGEVLVETARRMEQVVHDSERSLAELAEEPTGTVRLAIAELLAVAWAEPLTRFLDAHPRLSIEVVAGERFHSLSKREADVALRVSHAPPEHLIARQAGRLASAVYAHERWADVPLHEVPWVGWDRQEAPNAVLEQVRQRLSPQARYSVTVNGYAMMLAALDAGSGASWLPCVLGDRRPNVVRITPAELLSQKVWVLTHPDLRRSGPVRAVVDWLAELADSEMSWGQPSGGEER